MKAGNTLPDQRSQGFTLAFEATFASLADMQYWETDKAHEIFKKAVAGFVKGYTTVYFEAAVQF